MAQQMITVGAFLNDPSAESVHSAFTKVDAMTLEQFTALSLGGRQDIDMGTSPDAIRVAFQKTNTNISALYTAQGLSGLAAVTINVGAALDDPAADSIQAAFTKVNQAFTASYAAVPSGPVIAFPGAEGFGATTRHAYAGSATPRIIRVNTLADSTSPPALTAVGDGTFRGSFRAACLDPNPRIIVFEVSGYIVLKARITITAPFCCIAGATAPSPGISLRDYSFSVQANDVLLQHIRTRVGTVAAQVGNGEDGFYIYNNADRIVLDHLSVAWAVDGSIDATSGLTDVTISNCLMAEPCRSMDTHGPMLISGTALRNVCAIKNLFAHAGTRCPRIADGARAVAINNFVYDEYTGMAMQIDDQVVSTGVPVYASFVNNRCIQGPTGGSLNRWCIFANDRTVPGSKIYETGNTFVGANYALYRSTTNSGVDPRAGVTVPLTEQPLPTNITILAASAVEAYTVANAGARPLDRDPVDVRVIANVQARTATSTNIQTPASVGGYPALAANTRALTVPASPHTVSASGYTNLETWLHRAAASVTTPGSPSWP